MAADLTSPRSDPTLRSPSVRFSPPVEGLHPRSSWTSVRPESPARSRLVPAIAALLPSWKVRLRRFTIYGTQGIHSPEPGGGADFGAAAQGLWLAPYPRV